jgi:UDP-GlcNAc3NAcA epimerase
VLSVVGNRPQFVKSAPLSVALREAGIDEIVVHTGQHYDTQLSQVFYDELGLPEPDFPLELHTASVNAMRIAIGGAIADSAPDLVLVYGDTNSTLAGALAAHDAGVPQAHVEAGLRSGDRSMPEETNRIEVDRLAAVLFCPDERSAATLEGEGVPGRRHVVGDVMADAAMRFVPIAEARSQILESLRIRPHGYAVATVHRVANTVQPRLGRIVDGLNALSLERTVIFPVHPRTRAALKHHGLALAVDVREERPLGYLDFIALASQARVILTDSGGLQKEAYWYGVPCVTMRPSTEWVATVELGANVLVDDDPERIVGAARAARFPNDAPQLYGDGHAAERIAEALVTLSP